MTKHIFLAGLFHETNTFIEQITTLDDFEQRYDEDLFKSKGDSSPLGGFFEVADKYQWQVIPAVDFRASPSGLVHEEVFETYWYQFEKRLIAAKHLDAIYLVLHGAMTARGIPDVEGELLKRIRRIPRASTIPIFGVYDLHANFTAAMATNANCLVAYRENPHIDARESAVRAAELLARCLATGEVPQMHYVHPPIIWPPTGTGTQDEPMKTLEHLARSYESKEIWVVNVNAGFSFADAPETGVSFSVATTTPDDVPHILDHLASKALELKHLGNVIEPEIDDVLAGLQAQPDGPILLVEPSDNVGAGAPGDGTGILRALLKFKIGNAAVVINDSVSVEQLKQVKPGETCELDIGGKGSRLDPGPVALRGKLVSLSDGNFTLEDLQSHLASMRGSAISMGPCAVIEHQGIFILLTSQKTPPFDLGQLRSQGIEPTTLAFIGVKAAVAHRRAYDPIAAASYMVRTPGPCASDLKSLPFVNVKRPIFPLDDELSRRTS